MEFVLLNSNSLKQLVCVEMMMFRRFSQTFHPSAFALLELACALYAQKIQLH